MIVKTFSPLKHVYSLFSKYEYILSCIDELNFPSELVISNDCFWEIFLNNR